MNTAMLPQPTTAVRDPKLERDLQLNEGIDAITETLVRAKYWDGGGSGLGNVRPATIQERHELRVIAARAMASVLPSVRQDCEAAAVGTVRALVAQARKHVDLRQQDHSEAKHLIRAVLDDFEQCIAIEALAHGVLASQHAILDAKIPRMVRYPLAIETCGSIHPLRKVGDRYDWIADPPACECGELLTEHQEFEGPPVIVKTPDQAPAVVCVCGHAFEITDRVVYGGQR